MPEQGPQYRRGRNLIPGRLLAAKAGCVIRLFLKALICWGSCVLGGTAAMAAGQMGANTFDLLLQFIGRANGGDGSPAYRRVTRALGVKSIRDARDAGFTFLRVSAAGFGPVWPNAPEQNQLGLWQSDPSAWWANVDAMFDELDHAGLRIVPSFLWNPTQFPTLAGETVTAFIEDPASHSRSLAKRYISEFVTRYRARKTILFYEMGNEWNNNEDLDAVMRCQKESGISSPVCQAFGNYSSDALIAFSRDIVALIKSLDLTRGVSSGFGTPRYSAAHLAQRPEFAAGGPDWTPDTQDEFTNMLLKTSDPFDIVSLHVYPGGVTLPPAFGAHHETDVIDVVAKLVRPLGKKVFVGEFGAGKGSTVPADVARAVAQGTADYAAAWVWEFYQASPYQLPAPDGHDFRIEPGSGDQILADLRTALHPPPGPPSSPRVVLTWPLPCASVNQPIDLSAVASVGASPAREVEFFVGGTSVGIARSVPFQIRFDPTSLGSCVAAVEARARGPGDTEARFVSNVRFNGSKAECAVEP